MQQNMTKICTDNIYKVAVGLKPLSYNNLEEGLQKQSESLSSKTSRAPFNYWIQTTAWQVTGDFESNWAAVTS